MSKVKYRSFRKSEETLWRSSLPENEVEKPINWSNTPEGYYLESTLLKDSTDLSLSNGEILGGKTGYTKKAGQCLISLAEIDGDTYMLITTGADGNPFTEQYNMSDARSIYEAII